MRITGLFEGHLASEQRNNIELLIGKRAQKWGEQHFPPDVTHSETLKRGVAHLPTRTVTVAEYDTENEYVAEMAAMHFLGQGARTFRDGKELHSFVIQEAASVHPAEVVVSEPEPVVAPVVIPAAPEPEPIKKPAKSEEKKPKGRNIQ